MATSRTTSTRKSSFVYKPRTTEQIKERANRSFRQYDSIFKPGFTVWRAQSGDNCIRYLPATWDGFDHYGYTVWEHRFVGSTNSVYLCLSKMKGKPCAICDAAAEAKEAGEKEEHWQLAAKERVISWILDRDADDPEKPQLYDNSFQSDQEIVALCYNERTGETLYIDHPDEGFDVTFKKTGSGKNGTKYVAHAIARTSTPVHDNQRVQDEILAYIQDNPIPDLLQFYDNDHLKNIMSGTVAELDEDLDVEPAPEPRRPAARNRVEETPFEEDQPAPRRRAAPVEPIDEEVDEETGEVTDARRSAAPIRSNGRTRVIDEVEEDEPAPVRTSPRASRGR